jgi:putative ABC transport system substrate-binding protein
VVAAFRKGLGEAGFVEGKNVAIDYRWARGQYARLPGLAAELVRRPVTVLVATGGEPAALAARRASSTIPLVFSLGTDPIKLGLVASYSHPGGHITGINNFTPTLEPKRMELLHEVLPAAKTIGILLDPNFSAVHSELRDVQEAARTMGLEIRVLWAGTDREIETAFERLAPEGVAALMVAAAPFFDTRRDMLVALAARHRIPAIYHFGEYAVAGGLLSYGVDVVDTYRQVGVYAGRILNGVKPADLPVLQPTKFELVVNVHAARALGLTIPMSVLLRADRAIE